LKLLFIGVFLALLLLLAAPVVLFYSGLQAQALVEVSPSARQDDVERIKALLYKHDPRDLPDGEVRTITVSERDLNIALRSLMPGADRQRARVSVVDGAGTLYYTLKIPANPLGEYFNLSLVLHERGMRLQPEGIQAGELSLPGWVLAPFLYLADSLLERQFDEYRDAMHALQAVSLRSEQASVTYRWDRDLAKQIENRGREVFLPEADRNRALVYYRELASVSRRVGPSASMSILLEALFDLALHRSGDGEAVAENRALLLVVGTVLNRSSMHRLVGGDPADLAPGHYYVRWTLYGRNDLAQHFGISAAIAVAGGSVLADSIGAYKELDDSRGGSGFSFPDLLADRAGVELAVLATGPDAEHVQQILAADGLEERDFIPSLSDLPEGLMEMEFNRRYRDLDDARYGHIKREIDTRVALLPIHRE
jgi:uncharacterized protein YfiM (DUF2279 family)